MSFTPNNIPSTNKQVEVTPDNAASLQRAAEAGASVREIIYDQPWLNSVARPLLIVILMSCCAVILATLVRRILPELPLVASNILLGMAILGAAVSTISSTILAQPNQRLQRTVGYRIAELGILLATTRLMLWLFYSGPPSFNDLITTPLSVIFDGIFWAALIIVTLTWSVAAEITSDLQRLALQADELYVAQHHYDRLGDVARTSSVDRTAILNGFVIRWVTVGIFMLFLSAVVRNDLTEQTSMQGVLGMLRRQIESGVAVAVIVYFLCGLLLIGLSQLALLRSRWILDKTPMRSSILRNWPTYVTFLVVTVALLAALMPLGDTFLLARILNFVISALFMIAWSVMQFIMGLFVLLLSVFAGDAVPPANAPQAVATFAPPPPPAQNDAILPDWTGGVIFWALMAFLLGNAALIYFGGKHFRLGWLRRLWDLIRLRWQNFTQNVERWQKDRLRDLRVKSQPTSQGEKLWERRIDPDTLSPLEQVRYYYLSLLHQAEKAGIPRAKSETPLRYAPRLQNEISAKTEAVVSGENKKTPLEDVEKNAEIELLTKIFVNVRYAGSNADAQTLTHLRKAWKSLQNRLQQM